MEFERWQMGALLGVMAASVFSGCGGSDKSSSNDGGSGGSGAGSSANGGAPETGGSAANGGHATGGGGGGTTDPFAKFPDTSSTIAIFADQLPDQMNAAQQKFAVTHYVGTQKLTLALSTPLRALNPKFLVLHYHLAIWQSAPSVSFIIDGKTWGNDYDTVNQHESWFWHNESNQRVAAIDDGKLLMNIGDAGFQSYWASSLEAQVAAGKYDGIFFDSAGPDLLQWEAQMPPEPRLTGTGARDSMISELGNKTYIEAWEGWLSALDAKLKAKGIALIPNDGGLTTGWDTTDYSLTSGMFSEGFANPMDSESDGALATDKLLSYVKKGRIVILQNYLSDPGDVATRRFYLANYLFVKGDKTYLDYFKAGPFEWYPEWGIDLGAAMTTPEAAADAKKDGVYRRDFAHGAVLINPTMSDVAVDLGGTFKRVVPTGGGAVQTDGQEPGSIDTPNVTSITVPKNGAEILLR
jgi:hypothetical protein